MSKILIVYGTSEGQTARIAQYLADTIGQQDCLVDLLEARSLPGNFSIRSYDSVLIGASLHLGRFQDSICDFVKRQRVALEGVRSAFFSVSFAEAFPPGRSGEERARLQKHIDTFLHETGWSPQRVESFAGALTYSRYGFSARRLVKSMAKRAGRPTDLSQDCELTDWAAVARFGEEIAATLEPARLYL